MRGGLGTPSPPGAFLEVLILIDFKSFAPEVVIPKGLKWRFSEVLILEGLEAQIGQMCLAFMQNHSTESTYVSSWR